MHVVSESQPSPRSKLACGRGLRPLGEEEVDPSLPGARDPVFTGFTKWSSRAMFASPLPLGPWALNSNSGPIEDGAYWTLLGALVIGVFSIVAGAAAFVFRILAQQRFHEDEQARTGPGIRGGFLLRRDVAVWCSAIHVVGILATVVLLAVGAWLVAQR